MSADHQSCNSSHKTHRQPSSNEKSCRTCELRGFWNNNETRFAADSRVWPPRGPESKLRVLLFSWHHSRQRAPPNPICKPDSFRESIKLWFSVNYLRMSGFPVTMLCRSHHRVCKLLAALKTVWMAFAKLFQTEFLQELLPSNYTFTIHYLLLKVVLNQYR